ncbi:leucine-rich repeat neuronal protein 2-like isoform X1 [Pollicipes pollicipes]|uniref:leucine-rich repeat neuronal protein 2-like isoform X1 n=1 Tax=Pollicipes pollicipes TaxID=41117 RepID=UPI001884A3BC|nr:leucine-rich repeat neuronal protein 2-like isoform X1 [Pollicipes pollicipes]
MKTCIALSVTCLALVLPSTEAGFFFGSTVCSQCKCTEADPYIIDCTDLDLGETFGTSDTWPANKSGIQLQYDQNSLTQVVALPALDVVDLSFQHNDVTKIADDAFQALSRLRRLDLSHNKLSRDSLQEHTFRGQYSANSYQPSSLEVLVLSYNGIHSIYEDAFSHLSKLRELDLSYNPLSVLDHHTVLAVTELARLRVLRLAGTGLRQLPTGFLHALITLRELDLGDNQLAVVPPDLYNSHAITSLRLNGNPIKAVDENSFNGMTKLEILNLSSMPKLEYIGAGSFSTLVGLRVLRCRDNPRLWSLSPQVFRGMDTSRGIFPLKELLLSGNNLTTLDERTVPFWDQLVMLRLEDNPWHCDCLIKWMTTNLMQHLETVDEHAASRVTCQSPPDLAGEALERLADTPDVFICPPEAPLLNRRGGSNSTLAAALSVGALVILIAAGVVGFLFWRRDKIRRAYSNKLYMTSQLGAVVVLIVCVFFFWFIVGADRTGVISPSDPILLRLVGSFFLFLLISAGAALYAIRRQTESAKYRARQQIRYRRAVMEEEVDVDDRPTVDA